MINRTCDGCGADLNDSHGYPRYYLSVSVHKVPNKSNIEYSVWMQPPYDVAGDYCDVTCLLRKLEGDD